MRNDRPATRDKASRLEILCVYVTGGIPVVRFAAQPLPTPHPPLGDRLNRKEYAGDVLYNFQTDVILLLVDVLYLVDVHNDTQRNVLHSTA